MLFYCNSNMLMDIELSYRQDNSNYDSTEITDIKSENKNNRFVMSILICSCIVLLSLMTVFGLLTIMIGCNRAFGECITYAGTNTIESVTLIDKYIFNKTINYNNNITEYFVLSLIYHHIHNCSINIKYDYYDQAYSNYNKSYDKIILVKKVNDENSECVLQNYDDMIYGNLYILIGILCFICALLGTLRYTLCIQDYIKWRLHNRETLQNLIHYVTNQSDSNNTVSA